MPEVFKILGQSKPLAATPTAVVTVGAAIADVVSTATVCNTSVLGADSFSLQVAIDGEVSSPKQYLYYKEVVPVGQTFGITTGITLSDADVLRFESTYGYLALNVLGVEVTGSTTEVNKILGQSKPAALTPTGLITVGVGKQNAVNTLYACNTSDTYMDSFRVSIAQAGAAANDKQYLYFDFPVPPKKTFAATIGVTLNATDVLRVYSAAGHLAFNAFGVEI